MQILDFLDWVKRQAASGEASLSAGFARDYLADRLAVTHPQLVSNEEVIDRDWSVVACLVFGRDLDGDFYTEVQTFDGPVDELLVQMDPVTIFRHYLERIGLGQTDDPRQPLTATYGGLLICRHDGLWDVIGYMPAEIDQSSGLTWQARCFAARFPNHNESSDTSREELMTALLAQALSPAPIEHPAATSTTTVSKPSGGDVYQRLRSEVDTFGLAPKDRLYLRSALKALSEHGLPTLAASPGAPPLAELTDRHFIWTIFLVHGWSCDIGDCMHTEVTWLQRKDPMAGGEWIKVQVGFHDLWLSVSTGKELSEAQVSVPKGLAVAWLSVADEGAPDVEHDYILMNGLLTVEDGLSLLRDELNTYFNTSWE